MQRRIFGKLAAGFGLSAGLLAATALQAQGEPLPCFPSKTPLRMVVGYPASGATDRVRLRIVADRLRPASAARRSWKTKPGAGAACRQ